MGACVSSVHASAAATPLAKPPQQTEPPIPKPITPPAVAVETNTSNYIFNDIASKRHIDECYGFADVIGKGQFGVVTRAISKNSGAKFACKSISKKKCAEHTSSMTLLRREVDVMRHLKGSSHVVSVHEIFEEPDYLHIVIDLCEGGDLYSKIEKSGKYTEHVAASIMAEVLQAIHYCHSLGVIHRDIKPENFLLTGKTSMSGLKLADFGFATFFVEGQPLTQRCGSPMYLAPEVLSKRYGKEADIWSCGVVCYELLAGLPPFIAKSEEALYKKILKTEPDLKGEAWRSISEEAKDFVSRILVKEPAARASLPELLHHPWLTRFAGSAAAADGSSAPELLGVARRIRKFSSMNLVRKTVHRMLAEMLSPDDLLGLNVLFLEMDLNRDGKITPDELMEGLRRKGTALPEAEAHLLFEIADTNSDGWIDYQEFIAATLRLHKFDNDQIFRSVFAKLDTNNEGSLGEPELSQFLGPVISASEVHELLVDADCDADGRINFDDFKNLLTLPSSKATRAGLVALALPQPGPKADEAAPPLPDKQDSG